MLRTLKRVKGLVQKYLKKRSPNHFDVSLHVPAEFDLNDIIPDPVDWFRDINHRVIRALYGDKPPSKPIDRVSLHFDYHPGVAYTTGSPQHKKITVSIPYIQKIPRARQAEELTGVVLHEAVHVWQNNGKGQAPPGLIEGIADYVRLKEGLAPPHWTPCRLDKWDQGYDKTARLLQWAETKKGRDVVRDLNRKLEKRYRKSTVTACLGQDPDELCGMYNRSAVGN